MENRIQPRDGSIHPASRPSIARLFDFSKNAFDNVIRGDAFTGGSEIRKDAVSQHRQCVFANVSAGHAGAAGQ